MRSALALGAALLGLALIALFLSYQLQERWPILVFFLAFFGVALFLGATSLWQRMTEPKEISLQMYKQHTIFGVPLTQPNQLRSGWTLARAFCIWVLGIALATFVLHSLFIGGDAIRGYIDHNHYFVRMSGTVTEVTADQWYFNLGAAVGVFLLLPLTVLVSVVAYQKEQREQFRYLDMQQRR